MTRPTLPALNGPSSYLSGEPAPPTRSQLTIEPGDRPDAPLGTLLFRAGLVPEDELRDALDTSIAEGRRLGEVLLERGLVAELDLTRILAAQKGLLFFDVRDRRADLAAVRLLPEEKARLWGALPVAFEEGLPVVAVGDPANRRVFGEITEALGRKPRFVAAVPATSRRRSTPPTRRWGGFPRPNRRRPSRLLVRRRRRTPTREPR